MSTFNELIDFTRSTTGTYLDSVVYGDELVTNGTFATDSDWSKGATWSFSEGRATHATGNSGSLKQTVTTVANKKYVLTCEVVSTSAILLIGISSIGQNFTSATGSGVFSFTFTAPDTTSQVEIYQSSGATCIIDNVSVKEVIGGQVSGTPLLRTAAINEPRLEYDASGNPLGLLIEEARTNVLAYSEEFGNWTRQNVSISSNQTAAPDGTNTADKVEEQNTNNTFHFVTRSLLGSSAGVKTFSAYVKADERSFAGLTLRVNGGSDRLAVLFNLTSGTVSDTLTAGSPTQTSSSIQDVGNGWYRCSISAYHSAGYVIALLSPHDDGTSSTINLDYAGIVGHGIYAWGAQAETGAFPTSYIPTSGSTVTRTADIASLPVERFAYNQSKGSLVVYANAPDGSNQNRLTQLVTNGGSSNRVVDLHRVINSISMYNGTSTLTGGTFDASNDIKAAGVYKSGSYALVSDGGSTVTNSDTTVNTPDTLMLGANGASARQLNGHIKQIQYYPKRLSNTELQLLTQPSASPTMNLTFDGQATSTLVEGLHD